MSEPADQEKKEEEPTWSKKDSAEPGIHSGKEKI